MLRELTPALAEIAVNEIKEDPEQIQQHLEHLRDWCLTQSNVKINTEISWKPASEPLSIKDLKGNLTVATILTCPETGWLAHIARIDMIPTSTLVFADQWLIAFLRGSKYNIDVCKKKMGMYYKLRSLVPELFSNKDPFDEKNQNVLKAGVFLPLIKHDVDDQKRKILVRYGAGNGQFLLTDLIKVSLMISEILMLEDDNLMVAGEVVLVDMTNMGWGILSQWTPALAKKVVNCFEDALPIRLKGIHTLNSSPVLQIAVYILKLFIGKKLKKRLFVYSKGSDEVLKNLAKPVMPIEYGGDGDKLEDIIEYWKNKVESYRDWFLNEDPSKYESVRPGI